MKKIFIILALLAVVFSSGCNISSSDGKSQLKSIKSNYLKDSMLAPDSLKEIDNMDFELRELKKKLGSDKESIGVKILIDSRLELLEMGKALVNGRLEYRLIRQNDIKCEETSHINQTSYFFSQTVSHGRKAVSKLDEFEENYSSIEDVSALKENITATVNSLNQVYEEINAFRDSVC